MQAHEILKKYWNYHSFRGPQEKIIEAVLQKKDVLAILPTGGGKSICFQVPALVMDGICLVITPLIALMQDQVKQLKQLGIPAIAIHSGLSNREIDIQLDNCVYGKIKFLYLSPERLQTEIFQERFKKMNVNLIAIDEAHCISQWGHDFRPPYLQIAVLRELKPNVPMIALTASATKLVQEEIAEKLKLQHHQHFQSSFARDNISFVIRQTENKEKKMLEILNRVQGTAIVYVRSRKLTVSLFKFLEKSGISAIFYHAGLTHQQRAEAQDQWITNQKRVMVATNAFGMGINKADVRTVIHMDLPEDIESYYQEAGRGGRDGRKSYAVLVYHEVDIVSMRNKVVQSQPTLEYIKKIYQALANYYQLALGSAMGESFDFDLDVFCKRFSFKAAAVYPALKKLEETGLIQFNESFYRPSRLHISMDRKKIYEFQVAHAHFDPLIKTVLRLYGAELFSDFVNISVSQISSSLKRNFQEVNIELDQLHKLQVVVYEPTTDHPQITFVLPRQDADHLPVDKVQMDRRRDLHFSKMEAMIHYAHQTVQCRMQVMQEYFGEVPYTTCGKCDVCLEKKKSDSDHLLKDYKGQVIQLLAQKPMTVEELETTVSPKDAELFVEVIRELVDEAKIEYDEFWVLHCNQNSLGSGRS